MAHTVTEILDYPFLKRTKYMHIHTYFLHCTGICHTINPKNQTMKSDLLYFEQINPLELELSAQCTLQKTRVLNGCILLCMFLTYNCSGLLDFSATHCASTIVSFWCQRGLEKDLN